MHAQHANPELRRQLERVKAAKANMEGRGKRRRPKLRDKRRFARSETELMAQMAGAALEPPKALPPLPSASQGFAPRREKKVAHVKAAGGLDSSPLEPRCTFDAFVQGGGNSLAIAAAKSIVRTGRTKLAGYNPIVVQAEAGMGKTHLLQATAAAAQVTDPSLKVVYLSAEDFMYRFVPIFRGMTSVDATAALHNIDLLIVDDIQFLNGRAVQEEFGGIVEAMVKAGRQIFVATNRPVEDLKAMDAVVRTRLAAGLLVDLGATDYAMRKAIIENRLEDHSETFGDLQVPDEVVDYVARNVTTNGRDLDGALTRIVAHNQITGVPITLKMADKAIGNLVSARGSRTPKIEDVQQLTSVHFGVSRQDLVSARRTHVIVRPRQVAMYLSKKLTPRSLPEIGRRFGNRDHTTVLHAIRKVKGLIEDGDREIVEAVEALERRLG